MLEYKQIYVLLINHQNNNNNNNNNNNKMKVFEIHQLYLFLHQFLNLI